MSRLQGALRSILRAGLGQLATRAMLYSELQALPMAQPLHAQQAALAALVRPC